jgi:hypothetical protein
MPKGGTKTIYSRTRHERMARLETLLAKQYSTTQIVRLVAAEEEVSERQVYEDLAEVYQRVQAEDGDERSIRLSRARRTWQRQYRRCVDAKDYTAANYALDRLCKLDGLFAPKKLEVSGTIGVSMQITTLVGILTPAGMAALEVLQREIAEAKERGLLPSSTPIDVKEPA